MESAHTITIRSEETESHEPQIFFVVERQLHRDVGGATELFPCPPETVRACTVLQSLACLPGDSPLPYDLKSMRMWLMGLASAPRSYASLLGAVQVAHFLGDERLDSWLQLAVNHLQNLLTSTSEQDLRSSCVAATERLGMDLLDSVLLLLPLSQTLLHLSTPSHVRAVQVRVHQDDHGPHLELQVPASLDDELAGALAAAVDSLPDDLQPVTVTLRHGEQRSILYKSLPAEDCAYHASDGCLDDTSTDVFPEWVQVAGILSSMSRLRRLFCSGCSLSPSTLQLLPTESLTVLHAAENDLGQRFSTTCAPNKRSFDACLHLSSTGINTTLQDLNLASNDLDQAMLPAYVSGIPHEDQYYVWNAHAQSAFASLRSLTSLDLSCNNLTSTNLNTLLSPCVSKHDPRDSHHAAQSGPLAATGVLRGGGVEVSTGVANCSHCDSERDLGDRLQSLDISGSTLTPPTPLVSTLEMLTALTRLSLSDTALRTADVQGLAPALMCMTAMRWLSIGGNRITQRAAGALGRAFVCMRDLERLDASGHVMFQLGPSGIQTLAPVLAELTALDHLDLRKQHMAAAGVAALAAQVGGLACVTCLELDHNDLGVAGASVISLALGNGWLPSLEVLGLSSSKLTDDALACLAPELLALASLRRVRLDNNFLGKWSGDWGSGSVGKDVLRRWLEHTPL